LSDLEDVSDEEKEESASVSIKVDDSELLGSATAIPEASTSTAEYLLDQYLPSTEEGWGDLSGISVLDVGVITTVTQTLISSPGATSTMTTTSSSAETSSVSLACIIKLLDLLP
jgi:hypothetical protein